MCKRRNSPRNPQRGGGTPCSLVPARVGTSTARSDKRHPSLVPVLVCGGELTSDGATSGGRVEILDSTLAVLAQRTCNTFETNRLTFGVALRPHI